MNIVSKQETLWGKIPTGEKFIKIPYIPEFIESVIFGYRMPNEIKEFIVRKMPTHIKFKQAIAKTSSIKIINSDLSIGRHGKE